MSTVFVPIDGVDFAPYIKLLLTSTNDARIADRLVVMTDGDRAVDEDEEDDDFDAERAYKIEDLLGIGKVYGEKLRKEGVTNTDKLLAACSTRHKRQTLAEKTDIPYKLVLAWAQKVELMKIHGVGPRGSNLLNAVFVRSVKDLAERSPENLAERVGVANAFKPRFLDNTPSQATVTKWIEQAKALPKAISEDK